jgi:hypothetical protein
MNSCSARITMAEFLVKTSPPCCQFSCSIIAKGGRYRKHCGDNSSGNDRF